jgi:flagellar biosynthesis protein FlhF
MQQFTIQAATEREAFERMQRLYGQDAVVLSHRDVRIGGIAGLFARRGVEITGYTRRRSAASGSLSAEELERRKDQILDAIRRHGAAALPRTAPTRATGERQGEERASHAEAPPAAHATHTAHGNGHDEMSREILEEIRGIKTRLENRALDETPPALAELRRLLRRNDFTDEYAEELEKRVRTNLSLDQIADWEHVQMSVLRWIGEGIKVHEPLTFRRGETRTLVVVGPSGVGKTTTIAKLAAKYGLGTRESAQRNVRIVTIDSYRIGAREQIESYSEIMQIPASYVETGEELRKVMDLYDRSVDLILIDTIGKSPKDAVNLARMKKTLDGAGHQCQTHLALSASTKTQDIDEILRQFEPFRYGAVILTKLDETSTAGNVVSALGRRGKGLSYITTGQRVPQDIERASRLRLLMNLEGFRVDRDELGRLFGEEHFEAEEWGQS